MEIIHTLKFTCEIPFLRMLRLLNIQMVQNLRKLMGWKCRRCIKHEKIISGLLLPEGNKM